MFKLLITFHKLKKSAKNKIITYLNRDKYLPNRIVDDVLDAFLDKNVSMYRLYMRNSPIGEVDLEGIIQERRNDYVKVNEVDMHHLYSIVMNEVDFKIGLFVNIIDYNVNGVKYFEVHKK